jgi:predicted RNA-binding Zn-ribbon protein involved in translation (DUF1610 family)
MFAISDGGTGAAGPRGILVPVVMGAFVIAGILWIVNRKKLDEIEKSQKRKDEIPKETGSAWKCPSCGKEVPPELSECWNCGTKGKSQIPN